MKGGGKAWAAWRRERRDARCERAGCRKPALGWYYPYGLGGFVNFSRGVQLCDEHAPKEAP